MRLQLCRWKFSHKETLWQTSFDKSLILLAKTENRVLCHPLGDLGITHTVYLWLVGKRVVDVLLVLIELFVSSHGSGAMSGYWSKSLC